jgi:hypothetical protein
MLARMATAEAVDEAGASPGRSGWLGAWGRWWLFGTRLDWGYVFFSTALVGAGYFDAWINRNVKPPLPVPSWEHVPVQVTWFAVTLYLLGAALVAWRREGRLDALIPEGYGLSAVGCAIFLVGIVSSGWWTDAFGQDFGVPALFRPPNLLQIAGAGLIVVGPLRASAVRGELMAGPTAVMSALLLLAVVSFFFQFDHPYISPFAQTGGVLLPDPSPQGADAFNNREEILGAVGLMLQTAAVSGVILWTLRQTRLPVGSVAFILTGTAFLAATQLALYSMVGVALVVGVLCEIVLLVVRPRSDRVLGLRLFAIATGALLSGVYLAYVVLGPGTWWPADMTYGTVLACAMVGGLMSYVIFPGPEATRAASVLWPALGQESTAEAPEVTVDRVEHALKVLHNTRDLAESPLVGMRSLANPIPAELRKTIEGAIEHLRASTFQQDAQAGQILDLYYVRRIGGHYAVQTRVGLSRAAYFNRRSYGVRRLVDRLRELEEAAETAVTPAS